MDRKEALEVETVKTEAEKTEIMETESCAAGSEKTEIRKTERAEGTTGEMYPDIKEDEIKRVATENGETEKIMEAETESAESTEPVETTETEEIPNSEKDDRKSSVPSPQKTEWFLAALLFLAAYIYYNCIFPCPWLEKLMEQGAEINYGVLLSIFTLLFIAAGLYYGCKKERKPGKESWFYLALTVAAALWLLIFSKSVQPIGFYVLLFLHGAAVYWLAALAGKRRGKALDEWALSDLGRGLFSIPFSNYGKLLSTAGNLGQSLARSKKENSKKFSQVLLGVGLSLPVLCIVVPLLVSADRDFGRVVANILESLFGGFSFRPWADLMMTLLIAMYLFGMFFGMFNGPDVTKKKRTSFSQVVMVSFLMVFVAVYFLFFAIKVAGISGAMAQIEEGTLWTSTYARDGFFELCGIAAINFLMFSLVKWYSPRATQLMKITLTVLGIQTLAFICLAFSRMGLYIRTYGLTFKRVFTCWFMGVLFITFGLLMAELWKKFNGLRIAVIIGALSFLALAYSDMPAWMTAYNTSFQASRAVECRMVSRGDHAAVLYEGREYVPFCAIDPGYRGDYLGYMENDEDDRLYEFEGYPRQEWIINYLDSGLMDDCMLFREVNVTGSPEGLESEYDWN